MLRTIVEGEPGIFPDPVARIMRGIGGLFRRRPPGDTADTAGAPSGSPPADATGAPSADATGAPSGSPPADATGAPSGDAPDPAAGGVSGLGGADHAPGDEGRQERR